jgi:hypothetical protein
LNFELHINSNIDLRLADGMVVVVEDQGARRFAQLLKLNPVRCKIRWLLPQKQTKKGNQYSISPEDKSTSRVNIIAGLPVHVAEGDTSVIVPKDLIEKHILEPGSKQPVNAPGPTTGVKKKSFAINLAEPVVNKATVGTSCT